MYDITPAVRISQWTNLGVELPEKLAEAIERLDALRYVEVGYQPVFDVASVTAENAEDKVREFAKELAEHIPHNIDGARLSVLDSAKQLAVDEAARAVRAEAARAIPKIIEQLTPAFEEHAEAYADAVLKLPETITSEILVNAGAEAITAYGVARTEAAYIRGISAWLRETAELTGGPASENYLLVLAPEDALQLIQLDKVNLTTNVDKTFADLVPVYFAAARMAVPFRLNVPRAAAQIRRDLELVLRSQQQQLHAAYSR